MSWTEVKGHEQIIRFLTRTIQRGRVSHAYALVGPEGIGKAMVAKRFLQTLLCPDGQGGHPCGACRDCRRVTRGLHPDVHWLSPDGDVVRIEQIRQLQADLALKPFEARLKGAVIERAERMTTAAQNCLLKLLEEPPGDAVILLVATNASMLLPTIRSRCQILRMQPLPRELVLQTLVERGIDPTQAQLLAAMTEGRLGAALEASERDVVAQRDRIAEWLASLAEKSSGPRAILSIGQALEENREDVDAALDLFLLWLRDMVLTKEGVTDAVANLDAMGRLQSQVQSVDSQGLAAAMSAVHSARMRLQANANLRLTLDVMLAQVQRSLVS